MSSTTGLARQGRRAEAAELLPAEFPDYVDHEGELCVVIGKPCHAVRAEDAWEHVATRCSTTCRRGTPFQASLRRGRRPRVAWRPKGNRAAGLCVCSTGSRASCTTEPTPTQLRPPVFNDQWEIVALHHAGVSGAGGEDLGSQ